MGSFFKNLVNSIFHNAIATAIGGVAPIVVGAVNNGPTGGALTYAQHNPWMMALWFVGSMAARDKLKNFAPFATASGTVAPIDAAAGIPKQS